MNKQLKVSRGKDLLSIQLAGHSYVRITDEAGNETFRSDSDARHVNAIVSPGRYVVETDGKLNKLTQSAREPRHREARPVQAMKPPKPGK
jgi:hypothetical protein